ncbi:MAG: PLDc N-terminal domain-containing protein [Steroidobacteraceae bacterium]
MNVTLIWARNPVHIVFTLALIALHLLVAARAITRPNRIPASRVAWLAVIMFLPALGVIT